MKITQLSKEDQATVASIYAQCTELGECRLWTGGKTEGGYPRMYNGERQVTVRRVLAGMKIGRPLKPREMASCTCGEITCLEWDHIRVADISTIRAEAGAKGNYSHPTKGMRISMARRKDSKLNDQRVRDIRDSTDPSHIEAAKHGISPSMVRRVRAGDRWRDHASPFAGLGAR